MATRQALPEFEIEDAVRESGFLRLAVISVSGGGKTAGILRVGRGLVEYLISIGKLQPGLDGKIGIVDTEKKSAVLYQNRQWDKEGNVAPPFKVVNLNEPYTTERYLGAVASFYRAGFPVIGIDQLSHAWSGSGGLLEKKEKIAKEKNRNDWNAFSDITPEQNAFIETLLGLEAHLIVSMRSKTKWVVEEYEVNGYKKTKPKRIGMGPQQRAGIEYEFTIVLQLDLEGNVATVMKDRSGVFGPPGTVVGMLTEKHGAQLGEWLCTGKEPDHQMERASPAEQLEALTKVWGDTLSNAGTLPDLVKAWEDAQKKIREVVEAGGLLRDTALRTLLAAKDKRKVELNAPDTIKKPDPGVELIGPQEVIDLEENLMVATIALKDFSDQFGIVRLQQLPAARLKEAYEWISAERAVQ